MLSFFLPGRNRKLHHTLRLTALVLMIALMYPTVAPVCTAMGAPRVSQVRLLDAADGVRKKFILCYRDVWKEDSYDAKVKKAVRRAFKVETDGSILENLKLSFADKATLEEFINDVSESLKEEFSGDYEIFLNELQKRFYDDYSKLLVQFCDNEVARIVASINNPFVKAEVRVRCEKLLDNNCEKLAEIVNEAMRERHPGYASLFGAKDLFSFIGGLILFSCSEGIVEGIGSLFAGSSAGAAAAAAVPGMAAKMAALGLEGFAIVVMAWSIFKIGSQIAGTTDRMRRTFTDKAVTFFNQNGPDNMWGVLEKNVIQTFDDAAQAVQDILEEAENHQLNPDVQNYVQELLKNRKEVVAEEFYQKLAGVTVPLKITIDEAFIKDFAPVILKTNIDQIPELIYIINQNRTTAAQWFKLNSDDPQEILNFFSDPDTQSAIWRKYAPNQESLEDLRWIFQLSDSQRLKAIELDQEDITWLRKDFPGRYVSRLFREEKKRDDIADEIERLHGILVKEDRRPWMDGFEFWFTKYRIYLFMGIGAIALLFGLYAVLKIWKKIRALFPSKKKSDKKTDGAEKKTEQSDKSPEQSDKKTEN